jgi:hypothetical protein
MIDRVHTLFPNNSAFEKLARWDKTMKGVYANGESSVVAHQWEGRLVWGEMGSPRAVSSFFTDLDKWPKVNFPFNRENTKKKFVNEVLIPKFNQFVEERVAIAT